MVNAWESLFVDDVLVSIGNMSMEEGLLVCHFLEVATKVGAYPERFVAVVTTHYAQMVWLQHCVDYVSNCLCGGQYPILLEVATLDRFHGLQAQVILASLVPDIPGIMTGICRTNTLTSRAPSELHLFGRFVRGASTPRPVHG